MKNHFCSFHFCSQRVIRVFRPRNSRLFPIDGCACVLFKNFIISFLNWTTRKSYRTEFRIFQLQQLFLIGIIKVHRVERRYWRGIKRNFLFSCVPDTIIRPFGYDCNNVSRFNNCFAFFPPRWHIKSFQRCRRSYRFKNPSLAGKLHMSITRQR